MTRYALLILSLLLNSLVFADQLTWVPPTEYVNGSPIGEGELAKYSIFKEGVLYEEVPATQTTLEIPPVCQPVRWTATVTSVLGNESEHSEVAIQEANLELCLPLAPFLEIY